MNSVLFVFGPVHDLVDDDVRLRLHDDRGTSAHRLRGGGPSSVTRTVTSLVLAPWSASHRPHHPAGDGIDGQARRGAGGQGEAQALRRQVGIERLGLDARASGLRARPDRRIGKSVGGWFTSLTVTLKVRAELA